MNASHRFAQVTRAFVLANSVLLGSSLAATQAAQATSAAAPLTVAAQVVPNPVRYGSVATLVVHTRPGTTCGAGIVDDTKEGRSRSFGIRYAVADRSGVIRWAWRVDLHGHLGAGVVMCGTRSHHVDARAWFGIMGPAQSSGGRAPASAAIANGVTVTARNLHVDPNGDSPPPAGQAYIAVRVTLHNAGTSSAHYNLNDFSLQAQEDNIVYQVSFMDTAIDNTRLGYGMLAPGGTVSGDLSFQVPQTDTHFRLYWTPIAFGDAIRVPISS
jgi:hypothetical protein